MTDWKPKNITEALEDILGSALNDNADVGVNRDGEPEGPEYITEDEFDTVVKQAIKDIKESKNIDIRFKVE